MTALLDAGRGVPKQVGARALDALEPIGSGPGCPPTARGRISDYVYDELCEAIRSLHLQPRAPLSHAAIAMWLGVSRAPVQEAFTRLADQRLITIVPRVRSQVAPISMTDVRDAVFVRNSLETEAFRRAIAACHVDVSELQSVVDLNRAAFDRRDAHAFFETDELLHRLVFDLAGLSHLWGFVRGMKINLDRLRHLSLGVAVDDPALCIEHQAIADALANRDEDAGIAAIHVHSHRALADCARFRTSFPDYFAP
ncbi:GntR family transcriptional regulator [Microbacterium rhizosphaerae]|uniref:GntR family transcriptional regulator n=1 Tax=Microbacterium rhizosphaerae TaxID=1678237 RepID=A0ABZ0SJV9_9MICO|nr:GntR family transcriptional regulator [Microbacterium rhizosphaerae]WPR89110.1 GntR family transcriptional regulator [Microbacterium rhizosphaerae]